MTDVIGPGEVPKVHKKLPHKHSRGEKRGHPPKDDDYYKKTRLEEQHTKLDVEDHLDTNPETTGAVTVSEAFKVSSRRSRPGFKRKEKPIRREQSNSSPPVQTVPEPNRFKPQGGSHGKPWRGS